MGVSVPEQRKIARSYHKESSAEDILKLLKDTAHECRLTALFILIHKYERAASEEEKTRWYELYMDNLEYVNNWDLVDSSAYKIVGRQLLKASRQPLYNLLRSSHLWSERVAVIATYEFIKHCDYEDTLRITGKLMNHTHDLIHKACGWMLREIGKRDFNIEYEFLKENYRLMPRVMLRYAIEKFPYELRKEFLLGRV